MTTTSQTEGNHRLTTSISQEAYQVLTDSTSPRTIGKFLSELLVSHGKKRTLTQRVERLEEIVQQIQLNQPRSTAADRLAAKRISAEMAAGDYVTDEEFRAGLEAIGLSA